MRNQSVMQADLKGKVALITGASRGLGAYYAEVLAKNGASVVVSARSNSAEQLNTVVQALNEKGFKAVPLILDMTDFDSFDKAIEEIVQNLGSIDIPKQPEESVFDGVGFFSEFSSSLAPCARTMVARSR